MRRCAWCSRPLGFAPNMAGKETHGICSECEVRVECEAALAHAIVGCEAILAELNRARAAVWPPPPTTQEGA